MNWFSGLIDWLKWISIFFSAEGFIIFTKDSEINRVILLVLAESISLLSILATDFASKKLNKYLFSKLSFSRNNTKKRKENKWIVKLVISMLDKLNKYRLVVLALLNLIPFAYGLTSATIISSRILGIKKSWIIIISANFIKILGVWLSLFIPFKKIAIIIYLCFHVPFEDIFFLIYLHFPRGLF